MRAGRWVWGWIVVLYPTVSTAQEVWDWQRIEQLAQRSSPSIKSAVASQNIATSQLQSARSGFLPSVSAEVTRSQSRTDPAGPINHVINNNHSVSLSVRQNLYAGFRDQALKDAAAAQVDVAAWDTELAQIQLRYNLRQQFDHAVYYQDLLELYKQNVVRRRQNVSIVKLRFQGGREHKGSLLRSEAAVKQAEVEEQQAARELRLARYQLGVLLGQDLPEQARFKGVYRQPSERAFQQLQQVTMPVTVEQKQANAKLAASRATLTSEKSAYQPELDAFATVSRQGNEWPPDENQLTVGLSLTVPIYNGGKTNGAVRVAAESVVKAETQALVTQQQAKVDFETARLELIDALERVKVQESFASASQVQAELTRNQYTLGLATFQDWDSIENDLLNNQKNLLTSRKDATLAMDSWDKALGKKLGDAE